MWNGPGPGRGQRGGPPFRGDYHGEMFGGRDRPMPDFRGRDGMNMSQMGHMGPRPLDLPPMDMRRMDGPPMRGRGMDSREMRNREPNRDFFIPREQPDFNLRRQFESSIREKLMNAPGFSEPGRNLGDMGGRGMPPREPNNRFMDTTDREPFQYNMPQFNNPDNVGGRRGGFPMERRNEGRNNRFSDTRERPPMGGNDCYNMNLPPCDRRMDTDRRGGPLLNPRGGPLLNPRGGPLLNPRGGPLLNPRGGPPLNPRGGPPLNPRGGFESDTDFRNRFGPPAEFRGRDRSPLRFDNTVSSMDRGKSDIAGPQKPDFMAPKDRLSGREFSDSSSSPIMDYRSGEELTLAEEWKNRQKDKHNFINVEKGMGGLAESNFPAGFSRDVNLRDSPSFQGNSRSSSEFLRKDTGFHPGEPFPAVNLPSVGNKVPHNHPGTLTGLLNRETEKKPWLKDRDSTLCQNTINRDERPPFLKENSQQSHEIHGLKDNQHNQGPARGKLEGESDLQSTTQPKDQDYRDIDYRTESGRTFDYTHEPLTVPEKLLKQPKPSSPTGFSESVPQDQDYRKASVEDKVSNTISIIGIPKTATMEQILGAFADHDGAPMQGMKIKSVVPGYSYDTAYVEFLNLEDAVHFMESNKGSLKVGTRITSMKYIQPGDYGRGINEPDHNIPQLPEHTLPRPDDSSEEQKTSETDSNPKTSQWQRNSDLTPEAWQQQMDQQLRQEESEEQAEDRGNNSHAQQSPEKSTVIFRDSKTMIIKNVKPTTTIESILKALDPFAYLDERNVRLVKGKTPGSKCFCFVDMDSHQQVKRLVELLTKPSPLYVDGVRVYAEIARPLKNQNVRRDSDKPNTSILGVPPEGSIIGPQQYPQIPQFLQPPMSIQPGMPGGLMAASTNPVLSADLSIGQGVSYTESQAVDPLLQTDGAQLPAEAAGVPADLDALQNYIYGSEIPDTSSYLYDSTSGFYYDPETTLYYDPNSRYFYNAQSQEYLYWDSASKAYVPVPGGSSIGTQPVTMTAADQAILSNPAADAPLEMRNSSVPPNTAESPAPFPGSASDAGQTPSSAADKKDEDDPAKKDKEEKPRSLAAVKIMKDMERWAKIQNQKKEIVRAASPVLKGGTDDDKKQSKSADAGFAVFERKISGTEDPFKKPLAPAKKDEKSKRLMGSLGLLASDYAAGSDEEVEEDKEEANKSSQPSQTEEKDNKLTDWKKMACLLCRRQFPNKDALIRHQQLSDLHRQNMEIHLKIKRSKKELEALENQEKELTARESTRSPEQKRRKHHHHQSQQHKNWAGSSRETNKSSSDRPGLGAEPAPRKKEPVVWDHNTYKQAVRKAMFARFKELE